MLASLLLLALLGNAIAEPPDVVFVGGKIRTLDAQTPEATALAVHGGRIVAVGGDDEVRALVGPTTEIVDLAGGFVVPGLIDAHGHMSGLGSLALGRVDLAGTRSLDDVIAMIADKAAKTPAGKWVLGGRWDHESWPGKQLPTHAPLSAHTADNPVWVTRVDGHAGLANAAALRRAGITKDTPNPPGGEILRDEHGEPTGVLVDNAMQLVTAKIDTPVAGPRELILAAQERCLAAGLTGVHDAGIGVAELEAYKALAAEGKLKIRVYAMLSAQVAPFYIKDHPPLVGERLTVRAVKLYADGALGSRGAWLLKPYSDRPTGDDGKPYTGLSLTPPTQIEALTRLCLKHGYQVCTHAIGDRANREVLNAYEAALHDISEGRARRLRIEHAQILDPADIPRFAKLGVIASMQPTHCTSDMRWVADRLGPDRLVGAYAWNTLQRSGARLAGGSDFPVESENPLLGIYAAITRQDLDGNPPTGWRAGECLTRAQALRLFTDDAAYAAFEERDRGTLTVGKLADFVVLDRDLLICPPSDVPRTRVLRTVIGGETVYAQKPPTQVAP